MRSNAAEQFERALAERLGASQVIAVNSGTAALTACLMSLDLQPGDEVITTPYTFIATVNAIVFAGGRPVFADVLPDSLLIDPDDVWRKRTPRTRAVVPVHLFGRVCNAPRLIEVAGDLPIIEDACQALGADGVGQLDAACYSFYRTKNLSTFEGGAIALRQATSQWFDAPLLRAIINQGDCGFREFKVIGFNFRMAEPLALLGLHAVTTHWPGVLAELGRYGPQDGYYPNVVYDTPAYRRLGITGHCPVAEAAAARVRERMGRR